MKSAKLVRQIVLFILGCLILIVEVINAEFRDMPVHSGIVVLGLTLCGVGVTGYATGKINNGAR